MSSGSAEVKGNEYLTFLLGREEYGIDILRVQEIRGWEKPTPIPNTADYVSGVINLRGSVVPVIDLRRRFGRQAIPPTSTTVVVVVRVLDEKSERIMGLMVDAVCDVRTAWQHQIVPAPDHGAEQRGFVTALATIQDAMLILLDIDRLGNLTISALQNQN